MTDSGIFRLEIKTTNAAFEVDPLPEVARILRGVAERVESGEDAGSVRDVNGNRVGTFGLAMM